ncbi:MAG: SUMF1/EgtB/PvdO family nonheme iron enzyme [Candidatus Wallbacteria bacterium]|nr:SUMF1/EgtB/PvdO family nonheme iron enzyme [Candidatus Wallbacteria bacterium]
MKKSFAFHFILIFFLLLVFKLAPLSALTSQIPLKSGWNLISLGLSPDCRSIEVVFNSVPDMKYVMGFFRYPADAGTEGFRTYMNIDNVRDFSTLLTMDGYHGYWVYMNNVATLEVSGTEISSTKEATVSTGWNLVSYWLNDQISLPTSETQASTMIDSVFNQNAVSGIVKYIMGFYRNPGDGGNEGFRTFMNNSAISFSTLSSLVPNHGYWVYMQGQGILKYGQDAYWCDKVLDHITVFPSSISVPIGANYNLAAIVVTAYYTGSIEAGAYNPSWSVKSGEGSVNGSTYTAPSSSGSATLVCSFTKNIVTRTAEVAVTIEEGAPQAPVNLKSRNISSSGFIVSWDTEENASTYNIYKNGTLIHTGITGLLAFISGLVPHTQYTIQVEAVNSGGTSPKTTTLAVTTAQAVSNSSLQGNWNLSGIYSGVASDQCMWVYGSMSFASSGIATVTDGRDSNGNVYTNQELGICNLDSSGDITTPDPDSDVHGVLSGDGKTVVQTQGGGDDCYGMWISFLKEASFSLSDLQGTWYEQGIITGTPQQETGCYYATDEVDSTGRMTTPVGIYNMGISASGIVTSSDMPSFHGVMSGDKSLLTGTFDNSDSSRGFCAILKGGGSFDKEDLAGAWQLHAVLTTGWSAWYYGQALIDGYGNLINLSLLGSDDYNYSGQISSSLVISPQGIITAPGIPSIHGVMSSDKKMIVMTGSSTSYTHSGTGDWLGIAVKRTISGPVYICTNPGSITVGASQSYDLSNLAVNAYYSDGSCIKTNNASWSIKSGSGSLSGLTYTAPVSAGNAVLGCSFTENGVTKTAEINLTITGIGVHNAGDSMTLTLPGSVTMEFKWIPAGSFTMSSPDSEQYRYYDENPQHSVSITQGFWLGKYEVTQAQWLAVSSSNPSYFQGASYPNSGNRPVEQVSWNDCQIYIASLNSMGIGTFRLPTEAEWEYACRAGNTSAYYWGEIIDGSYCWYDSNSGAQTNVVGGILPNTWELYDMSGNVMEWCQDWYADDFYSLSPANDPTGPVTGSLRVVRGGCWSLGVFFCRSAGRSNTIPSDRYSGLGLRLVFTP